MAGPTREFWEERFRNGQTPWDRGAPNPQLLKWLADGVLRPCRVLVPGCGNGHEVALLAAHGFEVTALDYAPSALAATQARLAAAGGCARLVECDVLDYRPERPFDAVYEQTCLCALHPDHWVAYAEAVASWLGAGGRLYALFAQVPRPGAAEGRIEGPPYHCDVTAMRALFPEPHWRWPPPPYARLAHPAGLLAELALVLERTP